MYNTTQNGSAGQEIEAAGPCPRRTVVALVECLELASKWDVQRVHLRRTREEDNAGMMIRFGMTCTLPRSEPPRGHWTEVVL
jgi:hypothetical protein